jgi:hypothetical protein
MPRRDGTGPMGQGAMTGGGRGRCGGGAGSQGGGYGRGLGRGCAGEAGDKEASSKTRKELLEEEKEFLLKRIDEISKELESV